MNTRSLIGIPRVLLQKPFTLPEGWIIELSRIAELGIAQRGPIGVCFYQRGCPGPPTRTSLQLGTRLREGNSKETTYSSSRAWSGELSLCGFSVFFQHDISFSLALAAQILQQKEPKQKKNTSYNSEERGFGERPYCYFFFKNRGP